MAAAPKRPYGPSIIRCIECEGKTRMVGMTKIPTGTGAKDAVKCACQDCGVIWAIFEVDLPNRQKKLYQKRLTPKG